MYPGCGWMSRCMWLVGVGVKEWTLDVAGGRDGPWMGRGVGVEGCTLDVAGGRGGGMYPGCG